MALADSTKPEILAGLTEIYRSYFAYKQHTLQNMYKNLSTNQIILRSLSVNDIIVFTTLELLNNHANLSMSIYKF